MGLDMRALYYIHLAVPTLDKNSMAVKDDIKANENCLNQNFTILTQAISELSERILALENNEGGL
ncbi:MAG: hypothetical protein IJF80_07515 [Clostridia bacterium]|nr:hypothetical protein [Clostridia bacterium]